MSTSFLSPGWRMPRNANQSKQSNYSMYFDGGSSVINLGNTDAVKLGAGDFTFSAWINPDSWGSGYEGIYANNSTNGVYIGKDNAGNFVLRITSVSNVISYSTLPTVNAWTHICITRLNGTCTLYYNGSSVATGSSTHNFNANTNVYVGGDPGTGPSTSALMNGKITEVSIFDYALSQSQITTLYGTGSAIGNPMALPSSPIAYYPLGGSAGAFQTPVNNNDKWLIENNAIGDYVFNFDSTSPGDYISAPMTMLNSATQCTISFWGKKDASNKKLSVGGTINNSEGIWILWYNDGNIYFSPRGSGAGLFSVTYAQPYDNNWHHYLGVYDGSSATNCKLYLDGNLVATGSGTPPSSLPATTGDNFQIGALTATNHYSDGQISNVQVFNTTLSGPEVTTLYNYGSPIRTLANIPQNSNLKAWYKLDASEVYNSSTTEWSIDNNQNPSAYPSSLNFDGGTGSYINIVNGLQNIFPSNSIYTISTWVNMNSPQDTGCVWGGVIASNFYIYVLSSSTLRIGKRGVTGHTDITYSLVTGDWINIVAVYNSTTNVKIYIDNVFIQDVTVGANTNMTGDFRIASGLSGYELNCKQSNVSIWNIALTSAQVTEIYNNGTPSNLSSHSATSNLVSWWKLNNTTTGIQDSKGSNNGTNSGATEYPGFVNTLVGDSSGMSQANLVQSDLQTVAPYSKYALDFDGTDDYIDLGTDSSLDIFGGDFSVSLWFKHTISSGSAIAMIEIGATTYSANMAITLGLSSNTGVGFAVDNNWNYNAGSGYNDGNWHHMVATRTSTTYKIYVDNTEISFSSGSYAYLTENTIGKGKFGGNFNGSISNVSVWNTALTSSQVTEIYNQGLPSNLNSYSAYSNLVSWWQLGENSSFNGTDWIVADEIGSNNGESDGMGVDALTNGVGTTANGVSSGMSEGNLVGDAPYSTANALSSGMSVVSRLTDVPPDFDTSSFLYDGIDEYFSGSSVYSSLDGLSNYAVSCWFRSPNYSQTNEILHTSSTAGSILNQVRVYIRGDRRIFIDHGSNGNFQTYSDNTTLVDNQWYHILCTRDASRGIGDKMRIYISGVDKTANDNTRYAGVLITANQPLFIAKASNSTSNEMEGEIDEIAIYNQDMASYVSEIYAGGKVVNLNNLATAPNPISYFRSEKATWDGSNWIMKDVNSTYTVTSSNMEQADKTTNVP